MPEYRITPNGYAHAALGDSDLGVIFKNLQCLRNDAYVDFDLIMKGAVTIETLREANFLTGRSFAQFLEVNFDSGKGPLASLVRDIVHYLNGRCGHQTIITSLNIEENKLRSLTKARHGTYTPAIRSGGGEAFLKDQDRVYDNDLYRLMAGVGAGVVGRILLLLGGDSYYGSN